jgi:hypothetical protein
VNATRAFAFLDRYMKAISEQDLAAMQLPDGMTHRARQDARGGSRPCLWCGLGTAGL